MSRKYSTAVGLAAGAAAAAFIGMGTAHADTPYVDTYYDSPGVVTAGDTTVPNDAYDILFGAQGTAAGEQGFANNALDVSAADQNLTGYEGFANDVATFEDTAGDHGLENLIFALDPSAFYLQTTDGITGTVAETVSGVDGAYLVPDDFLGYLATGLDYGLLTPTGLDYVLTPLIDLLAGSAF
jgi:hypothetical protein